MAAWSPAWSSSIQCVTESWDDMGVPPGRVEKTEMYSTLLHGSVASQKVMNLIGGFLLRPRSSQLSLMKRPTRHVFLPNRFEASLSQVRRTDNSRRPLPGPSIPPRPAGTGTFGGPADTSSDPHRH